MNIHLWSNSAQIWEMDKALGFHFLGYASGGEDGLAICIGERAEQVSQLLLKSIPKGWRILSLLLSVIL